MPAASAMRTASAVGADTATDKRHADRGRLLDHFDRNAAGEHDEAFRGRHAAPRQRAGELVERVMAADVFADGDQPLAGQKECRGMDGAGFAVERLRRRQRIERLHDVVGPERRRAPHLARRPHGFRERFDAAQSAAGRSGKVPSALAINRAARLGEPHAQLDAEFFLDDRPAARSRRSTTTMPSVRLKP